MARCPKLVFDGDHSFYSDCKFICSLTGIEMEPDNLRLNNMCKTDYGEQYYDCPIYKKG